MSLCKDHYESERHHKDCSICALVRKLRAAKFDLLEAHKEIKMLRSRLISKEAKR